jgi:hypothetical protein
MGNPIVLEIDHIDGNNQNHSLDNLRYLCPNCHSQTSTWRGRNKNTGKSIVTDQELMLAISETKNIRQALLKVGLSPKGLNYIRVSKLMCEHKVDFKNSQYGTIWINDGNKNKKIKKELLDDYISIGYKKGRIADCYNRASVKDRFWITNGIINKMILPNQKIPEGFWRGKVQK